MSDEQYFSYFYGRNERVYKQYCLEIATRKRDRLIFILRDRGIFFPVILFCVPHDNPVLSMVVATRIIR